jgi:hypothetical protein
MRRNDFVNSSGKRSSITNRVKTEAMIAIATMPSTAPTEPRSAIKRSPMIHHPVTTLLISKKFSCHADHTGSPQKHNEGF